MKNRGCYKTAPYANLVYKDKAFSKGVMRLNRKHVDFATSIIIFGLSVYVISESIRFYNEINQRMPTPFSQSPGFFTGIIGGALFICSVLLFVRSVKGGAFAENFKKIKEGSSGFLKSPVFLKGLIGCVWMGLYIFLLLPVFGYAVGSVIFLVIMMIFLQNEELRVANPKTIAISIIKYVLVSVISVGALVVLFQNVFGVPLP